MRVVQVRSDRSREVSGLRVPADETIICKQIQRRIAFISGIYTELIESIKKLGGPSLRLLATLRLREFWREINGNFLAAVFVGILVAVFSLARAMTYLLEHHPIEIWAFFFGLIVASAL